MSNKEVVTGARTTGHTDGKNGDSGLETIDIGIKVDVNTDAKVDADSGVTFSFDEADVPDADSATATADAGRAHDTDSDRRLEITEDEQAALEAAEIEPKTVREKDCSYRELLDSSVDDSLADALRRRFSLPWSLEGGSDGDLERRSSEIRGLGDAEREWIAVSDDESWQAFEYAHTRAVETEPDEATERPCPRPTPVQAVTGVGPDDATALADAGIISAERLATINAFDVAKVLELSVLHVRSWRHNARELLE
ncbi:hypothetical protein G6M89_00075 [Natronolimnobius sp. AArcel1]|uniref:hypothetical protein n=1 Tax=Natronolimnobius sp. AArcel1 TaxID=1679093 RepID=UPI0013EDE176|nr:hypothetical protein [Natronolimnobius sp. AArcel1]